MLLVFGGGLAFIVFVSVYALFYAFVCSFEFDKGSFRVSSVLVLLCSPYKLVLLLSRNISLLYSVVCSSRAFVILFCILTYSLLIGRCRYLFDTLITILIVLLLSIIRRIGLVRSISNI